MRRMRPYPYDVSEITDIPDKIFTLEEKKFLADYARCPNHDIPRPDLISTADVIDLCDHVVLRSRPGSFVSDNLAHIFEKAQKLKEEMLENLENGPLVDMPVPDGEAGATYMLRFYEKRLTFPIAVRMKSLEGELGSYYPQEDLRALDPANTKDNLFNLFHCEKLLAAHIYRQWLIETEGISLNKDSGSPKQHLELLNAFIKDTEDDLRKKKILGAKGEQDRKLQEVMEKIAKATGNIGKA